MIPLVATLLLSSASFAEDLKKPDLNVKVVPFDVQMQGLTFPSGLRVILQKDPLASYVSVATVHSAGSMLDKPGRVGTHHLAEHLFYTAHMGDATVKDQLYAVGVDYDAQTIQDWAIFRATGPASALPVIIRAEGIRFHDTLEGQTEADLTEQKTIVGLEPYYWGAAYGWGAAWSQIAEDAHGPDSPYGQLHSKDYFDDVKTVTLDDIREYDAEAFAPANSTMVISGPIDFDETISTLFANMPPDTLHPDATEENLKKFFKPGIVNPDENNPDHVTVWLEDPNTHELLDLTDKELKRIDWEAPEPFKWNPAYHGEVVHVLGRVDTPIAVVAWAVPGQWVGQDAIKGIGATALGTAGYASWASTFEIAKGADGGPQAGCSNFYALRRGHILCTATARDGRVNTDELTDKLKAAGAVFWNPEATWLHEQATEGGRRNALGYMLHQLENYANLTDGLAARTALNAHFYGNPRYASELMNETMKVDSLAVRPWVQKWLNESRAVSIVVDPIPKEQWLDIPTEVAYHGSILGHTIPATEHVPTNEEVAEAYSGPDLSQAVEKTLPNGLQVVVLPFGSVPIATSLLVSRGGAASGDGLDTLGEITMRRIWSEIYEDPTGRKQEMLPEKFAAQAIFERTSDLTFEGFAAPRDNLDAALYINRRNDMARKVNLAGKSNWWKAIRLELPRAWDNRSWWAQQERVNRVLGDHPVKWTMDQADANRLKDVAAPELLAWYDQKFNPRNSILVIAGAVDPEVAMKAAESSWAGWTRTSTTEMPAMPPRPTPAGPATLFFDADGATHSIVSASCPLPTPTAAASAGQRVMASALQEVFAHQLDADGAEPLASTVRGTESAGVAWMDLYAVVPHDKVKATITALQATLAIPEASGFDPDRLQQYKLRVAGNQLFLAAGTRATAKAVGEAYALPYKGKNWYDDWGKALAEVDGAAIQKATEGCAANAVITIETPSAAFPELQKDFGAERIDWQQKSDDELLTWDKAAYKRRIKQRAKAAK